MSSKNTGAVKSVGVKIGIGCIYIFLISVVLLTIYPIIYISYGFV